MKTFFSILMISVLVIFSSCDNDSRVVGNNDYQSYEFNLSEFENVSNPFQGSVKLKNGAPKVIINAESNIIDLIDLRLNNKSLEFGARENFESSGIEFEIYSPDYKVLRNDGNANWTSDSLEINPTIISNGSGVFNLTGKSGSQSVVINGSGDVFLTQMPVQDINVEINGSGNLFAKVKTDAVILLNSSGNATIENISGLLNVTINGSGNLYYSGNPQNIIQNINGSGRIIKLP